MHACTSVRVRMCVYVYVRLYQVECRAAHRRLHGRLWGPSDAHIDMHACMACMCTAACTVAFGAQAMHT